MIFIPRDFISCKLDLIQRITPISKQMVRSWHFVRSVLLLYQKGEKGVDFNVPSFCKLQNCYRCIVKGFQQLLKGRYFSNFISITQLASLFFLIFIMKKIYTSRAYVKLKWKDIVFSLNKKIPVFEFSTLM